MRNLIEVKNLTKTYEFYRKQAGLMGSFKSLFKREKLFTHAVKDISFYVQEGELVGFLGPNGAGKTTTLKMLSGILYPTTGSVHVLGFVPWERKPQYQKQFSIVMGQKNQLWWDLPAMDSFLLNKEIYEVPQKNFDETIEELSVLLDVQHLLDVQVRKLSLGERMKMELMAALLHRPKILFLDEPTIGLDVVSQEKVREFISHYNKEKKTTILLTSHYMHEVEVLCDRIGFVYKGQLVDIGEVKEVKLKNFSTYDVLLTLDRKPSAAFVKAHKLRVKDRKIRVTLEGEDALSDLLVAAHKAGYKIKDMGMKKPTLEDYFIKVLGQQ